MQQPSYATRYRGIAMFGMPGSGKTSVAAALRRRIPGVAMLEASRDMTYPIAAAADLPDSEAGLLRVCERAHGRVGAGVKPTRDRARETFAQLERRFGMDVLSRTLAAFHAKRFGSRFAVLSGLRGIANAQEMRRQGYFIVYLDVPRSVARARLMKRDRHSRAGVNRELDAEERLFHTSRIPAIADAVVSAAGTEPYEVADAIMETLRGRECRRCVNSTLNPSVTIDARGLCDVCARYERRFSATRLAKERVVVRSFVGSGRGKFDALVGISGGKDSTAALARVSELGFTPLAFTLDTGYYPQSVMRRAREVAQRLGVAWRRVPVAKHARPADRRSFEATAALYDAAESPRLARLFRDLYKEARAHYSAKCAHALPFVRTCQLCRRLVIRAYYAEAVRHGVRVVFLGINEWAGLSDTARGSRSGAMSAIRKLQPFRGRPSVYVVHLPFLLRMRKADTVRILRRIGWRPPKGETLVETNANSCLFARAAEAKAMRMLGFHPDATRLSREVTVGYITKAEAKRALARTHTSAKSVRQVLHRAGMVRSSKPRGRVGAQSG